jgi:hypothetical protein
MSAHHCDNAFFDIKFGHNPIGITLATPWDMMHLSELGIVKRVYQMFVDSMSTDVSWKRCSARREKHTDIVRFSFAPTSVVVQCVLQCSATTTGQEWCLRSSCCC